MTTPITFNIKLPYKGLIRRLDYQYMIESSAANWPIVVLPSTGVFTASSRTGVIDAKAIFCPNVGSCPEVLADVMAYNLQYSDGVNNSELFGYLRAKIFEAGTSGASDFIYSDSVLVSCNDCVKQNKPLVSIPIKLSMKASSLPTPPAPTGTPLASLNDSQISNTDTDYREFNMVVSNLSPGDTYSYTIVKEFNNWPIEILPSSGSIVAQTNTVSIPISVKFCNDKISNSFMSPGPLELDGGSANLWNLNIDQIINSSVLTGCNPQTDMIAILKASLSSSDIHEEPILSNPMLVRCDKCIMVPELKLNIKNNQMLVDANNSNIDQLNILNLVLEGLANGSYIYELESVKGNWPFNLASISGYMYSVNRKAEVDINGVFCRSTAVCPTGQEGVLPYSAVPLTFKKYDWYKPSIQLRAKITNTDNMLIGHTNIISLYCTDCLDRYTPVLAE